MWAQHNSVGAETFKFDDFDFLNQLDEDEFGESFSVPFSLEFGYFMVEELQGHGWGFLFFCCRH